MGIADEIGLVVGISPVVGIGLFVGTGLVVSLTYVLIYFPGSGKHDNIKMYNSHTVCHIIA